MNAGCFAAKVPLVSGAAIRMKVKSRSSLIRTASLAIAASAFVWRERVNLRRSRRDGTVDRVIGSLQAMEAIKLLAGYGKRPAGKSSCTMR